MKKLSRIWLVALSAIIALLVMSGSVLQYHHHDGNETICLSSHRHDSHHHSHDNDCNHGAQDNCSLHLDKFLSSKHHICHDMHCAICTASVCVPRRPAPSQKVVFRALTITYINHDITCRGLRAPPAVC